MELNKYLTPLTDDLLNKLPEEVKEELIDIINNVEIIRRLISPNRPYAKDLPRDELGRIIVDICNPHILEDMDYFRPTALHYKKYGTITNLRPNPSPYSEYRKWVNEEIRRCWHGYVRESDGEWVTGDMYFYLNYAPIIISKTREGTKIADRIVDFPEVWEGIYLRFHYLHQARYGGLYNNFTGGQHAAEIAKRGCSKSYTMASILAKIFILGENEDTKESVRGLITAYLKEYLNRDGTLNKFVSMIDFCAQNTLFPSRRVWSSIHDMQWKMGYLDLETGTTKGTLNEVIGVSSKDDTDKLRGKRPHPLSCKVLTTNGIKSWGDIRIGDYVYNQQGKPVQVVNVIDYDEDDIYKITLKDGRVTYAQGDHLFPIYYRSSGVIKSRLEKVSNLLDTKWYNKKGIPTYKWALPKNECIDFNKQPLPIDPYTFGLYLGDGDYAHSWNTKLNLTMVPEDLKSILQYIPYEVKISKYRNISHHIMIDGARDILKSLGLENKKSGDKFIPHIYLFNSESNRIALLNGLLDTDGSCTKDYGIIEYSTKSTRLKDDVLFLCRSLGYNCTSRERVVKGVTYYKCYIYTSDTRLFNLLRKKSNLKKKCSAYSDRCPISSVELYNREKCRCITVDSEDGLYLIDEFIVTHNSSRIFVEEYGNFPKITDIYRVILPSVLEGDIAFGQIYLVGTGGSEGADFAGALEMLYGGEGYNIYMLPNYYDKNSQGKNKSVYFFGAYLNKKECYNHDGVSDVTKALIELLMNRYKVKYNTTNPTAITRTKAENPITIQEAIMRRDSTIFPVADLSERLNEIDYNPSEYNDVYVGEMIIKNGQVEFNPTTAKVIREYPLKDNKADGAIEIYKMPEKNKNGKVFPGRYIAGTDPVDDDSSETLSLQSTLILDLWTDEIVAEYTGRPTFANDYYEQLRRLLIFYNAVNNYENNKKGLFAYFLRMNSLYLLTDTLEFLKDKDMIKGLLYGNKSKGTNATLPINNFGRTLARDWLLKPTTIIKNIDGEDQEVLVPQLQKLRGRALIKELIQWNPDGNYDRVSALGMLMLLREDKLILSGGNVESRTKDNDYDYLGNDKFFSINYDMKFNKTVNLGVNDLK